MAQAKPKSQKTPKNTSKMVKNMKNPQKNFKFLKKISQKKNKHFFEKVDF